MLNGRRGRFLQTIKLECLNKFIIFGNRHLDYLVAEFTNYYNRERAHSSRENLPPASLDPPEEQETVDLDEIIVDERLGGLIKSYRRAA